MDMYGLQLPRFKPSWTGPHPGMYMRYGKELSLQLMARGIAGLSPSSTIWFQRDKIRAGRGRGHKLRERRGLNLDAVSEDGSCALRGRHLAGCTGMGPSAGRSSLEGCVQAECCNQER